MSQILAEQFSFSIDLA